MSDSSVALPSVVESLTRGFGNGLLPHKWNFIPCCINGLNYHGPLSGGVVEETGGQTGRPIIPVKYTVHSRSYEQYLIFYWFSEP
jgi:hypothetical protein